MNASVLQTTELGKRYGEQWALRGLSLGVSPGQICGLLGPNGAGKTTTIRLVLGIAAADEGSVRLFDRPYTRKDVQARMRIGVCFERHDRTMWMNSSGWEYLEFFSRMYGAARNPQRVRRLLEQFQLAEQAHRPLRTFSKGMIQKLSVVRALLHEPELIILDEPVSSLDPFAVKCVRDAILEARGRGASVLLCSHLLSEVERVCDKVAIINRGRLVAEDSIRNISARLLGGATVEVEVDTAAEGLAEALQGAGLASAVSIEGGVYRISLPPEAEPEDSRRKIAHMFAERKVAVLSVRTRTMSLEESFISITGKSPESAGR